MRSFDGLIKRFIVVLFCASTLLATLALTNLKYGADLGDRSVFNSKIKLVAEVECGSGCTFTLSPAEQKVIAGGGIGAWAAMAARACGVNIPCNVFAAAGAAAATMYVSEYGSDTCNMQIRIRPVGVTTAVITTSYLVCPGKASPAE
jgi:hypothetical protein